MFGLAFLFWLSSVIYTWVRQQFAEEGGDHHHGHEPSFWQLVEHFLRTFLGMVGMWCFYYATTWNLGLAITVVAEKNFEKEQALRWFVNAAGVTFWVQVF